MPYTILNFSTTNAQVTDEIINVSDSNPINLEHDVFYNKTGKLVTIYTGAGETGTQLVEGTDYDVGGVFPDGSLPFSISPDVAYTTIAITNATYHNTQLYVNYYPIGDLINADKFNKLAGSTTVTSSATVDANYITNVDAATATITVPELLPIGTRKKIRKISSSAGTITINRSGSDTFTRAGLTSITLTSDGDFWEIEKVSSTRWELVDGVEIIETGNKRATLYSDGSLENIGLDEYSGLSMSLSGSIYVSGTITSSNFAKSFIDTNYKITTSNNNNGNGGEYRINPTSNSNFAYRIWNTINAAPTGGVRYIAIGRWYG